MTRQFVPHKQALALQGLGFNEKCLADYLLHRHSKQQLIVFPDHWYDQNIEQYDSVMCR